MPRIVLIKNIIAHEGSTLKTRGFKDENEARNWVADEVENLAGKSIVEWSNGASIWEREKPGFDDNGIVWELISEDGNETEEIGWLREGFRTI